VACQQRQEVYLQVIQLMCMVCRMSHENKAEADWHAVYSTCGPLHSNCTLFICVCSCVGLCVVPSLQRLSIAKLEQACKFTKCTCNCCCSLVKTPRLNMHLLLCRLAQLQSVGTLTSS